ncbi:MAG: hypothetical protein R2695_00325 [Acidimicrobiales bacterium]
MHETLVMLRDRGFDVIEVDAEADARWTDMVDRGAALGPFRRARKLLLRHHRPGSCSATCSTRAAELFKEIARVRDTDYARRFTSPGCQTVAIGVTGRADDSGSAAAAR